MIEHLGQGKTFRKMDTSHQYKVVMTEAMTLQTICYRKESKFYCGPDPMDICMDPGLSPPNLTPIWDTVLG
jgi:hypothetical protein